MIDIIIDDSNHCIGGSECSVGSGQPRPVAPPDVPCEICPKSEDGAFVDGLQDGFSGLRVLDRRNCLRDPQRSTR